MKKITASVIAVFVLSLNSLFAQEIFLHKEGLKYDFRELIAQVPGHGFDVIHYQLDWKIEFYSQSILSSIHPLDISSASSSTKRPPGFSTCCGPWLGKKTFGKS